ncbi:ROK family transcriptional regulator [Microbacterium betulae]|uniref:ROK family transcriptional regulator n=1 Tax=Microbacterium betulae TaxID=2981139 RepID=A0AA97I4D2_9MICO|nr:ROK family transcriptional regulator [Microbacterium sp. AB]WOF22486.1 ROK family transcriptional regulator [Microbacterium sp. AB]
MGDGGAVDDPADVPGRVEIGEMSPAMRSALLEVLIHGELPRAEIARRLHLSRASLTRITRALVDAGLLAEGETRLMAQTGRPSELLSLRADARHFLGVKLTGDTLYAVVTDLAATIVASTERPLRSREVADVVAEIAETSRAFATEFPGLTSIGIAIAGRVSRARDAAVVERSAFLDWTDVPLGALVREETGLPCVVENDVQALTATEHWFGAGAGIDDMALVTVGVGIGCGLVVNGRPVEGAHSRAGQLSHLIVDEGGPPCGLGHRGCVSSLLVNGSIVAAYGRPDVDYAGVVAAARGGDVRASRVFADAGRALGVMIATVANLVDPRKIVLTGDGIAVVELAGDALRSAVDERLDEDAAPVDLDVRTWDFSEWARAGAGLAIRALLA